MSKLRQHLLSLIQIASVLIFHNFYDTRKDLKILFKVMYIKLIEKILPIRDLTLFFEIGYFINIAYNNLTFKISD